jgi:hypothetical protein
MAENTGRKAQAAKEAASAARAQGRTEKEVQDAARQAAEQEKPEELDAGLGKLPIQQPSVTASSGNALRYPSDRPISANSDYVIFEFFNYNPPFGRGPGEGSDGSQGTASGTPSYKTYNSSVDKLDKSGLSPILLYMPEDIQTQYSQKWGGAAFGSVAAGLLQTVGTSVDINTALDNIPGVIKSAVFDKLREGINKVAGAQISENQILGGVTGSILNPNTEMMYDGPELRTIDLTFKMVARSKKESEDIKKICTTFKKAMLPQFGGNASSFFGGEDGGGAGNLIRVPNICKVTFMFGSNVHPYLPQYKSMAISNVAINYTPDGAYATYENGSPIATQLKVSLKELKNIFASEISDGVSY